jgi:SAM-dependent methyltransferase
VRLRSKAMETTVEERIAASIAAYDENARAYKEAYRKVRPMADIRRFAQLAADGALVLDVGCGPASDMRALRDAGVKPVGVDISLGALIEARLLLPKDPLVRAPYRRLPFRRGVFGGLWLNNSFAHLPRGAWSDAFAEMMSFLDIGPVYFACIRGTGDLSPVDDDVLGRTYRSDATEEEIEAIFASHGLRDIQVEIRPDPVHDRKRPWVVALARRM